MQAGHTPAETVERLLDGSRPVEADRQILDFWAKLVDEGLIAEAQQGNGSPPAVADTPRPALPWTPPTLSAYSDMADLFKLDPIHDVDEAGWPSRPPAAN
jgi:hypothetical protein